MVSMLMNLRAQPALSRDCHPPLVLGTAALATAAFRGVPHEQLVATVDTADVDEAARLLDRAVLARFVQDEAAAAALEAGALSRSLLFRVRRTGTAPGLRILALMAPGNLMVNTPIDFMTSRLEVQLDLLFVAPGRSLPAVVPDHDVMLMAVSEGTPELLSRVGRLCARWPRPVMNDVAMLPAFARDRLPLLLAGVRGICAPECRVVDRAGLLRLRDDPAHLERLLPGAAFPLLVRPLGSHAGHGLMKLDEAADVSRFLGATDAEKAALTRFVDYRSADGKFRKYRVVMIEGRPQLCHLAVSEHWMVHYLNAGMTENSGKQAEEAAAMASFDGGFARRHGPALATIARLLAVDLFSIDCSELADGQLLVFEADTAAIIHAMDSPRLFPHKAAQMARVFAAFEMAARRRAASYPMAHDVSASRQDTF